MSTLTRPGVYRAKPVAHTISEPKEGRDDQLAIRFEFDYEGGRRDLVWFGSLHENALKHTLNAIENCGFKYGSLVEFLKPDAIDYTREVDIVVEHNTYNGKTSARVKWINRPGGMELKSMAPEAAKNRLAGYDILLREHRKSAGTTKQSEQTGDPGFDPDFDL